MTSDVATTPRKKLSPSARLKLFEKHKGICALCKSEIKSGDKWLVEHLRPLALGGTNDEDNLAPVHATCAYDKTHGKDGDLARAAKAKRSKMAALGIKKENVPKIANKGFPKVIKSKKEPLALPPRRALYIDK